MKILMISAALAALAVAGSAAADTRNVSGFRGVGAEGPFNVEVTLGDHYAVDVTGADAARILTELEHNSLRIHLPRGSNWNRGDARLDAVVHVTTPRLDALAGAAAANIRANGVREGEFSVAASSGSEINVAGSCSELSAATSSGGVINAADLACNTGNLAASTGGRIQAKLSDTSHAAASLGGDIQVVGNPPHRNDAASMGGNISYNH